MVNGTAATAALPNIRGGDTERQRLLLGRRDKAVGTGGIAVIPDDLAKVVDAGRRGCRQSLPDYRCW